MPNFPRLILLLCNLYNSCQPHSKKMYAWIFLIKWIRLLAAGLLCLHLELLMPYGAIPSYVKLIIIHKHTNQPGSRLVFFLCKNYESLWCTLLYHSILLSTKIRGNYEEIGSAGRFGFYKWCSWHYCMLMILYRRLESEPWWLRLQESSCKKGKVEHGEGQA